MQKFINFFFLEKGSFFLIFQIIEGHFYTILMVVIRKIVITNVPDRNNMIMCILFRKSTFTIINNLHKEYAPFDIYLDMDISVVMIYLRWINCA